MGFTLIKMRKKTKRNNCGFSSISLFLAYFYINYLHVKKKMSVCILACPKFKIIDLPLFGTVVGKLEAEKISLWPFLFTT